MRVRNLAFAVLCTMAGLSCFGTNPTVPSRPVASLAPVDTMVLAAPAAGVCRDGERLLLLESGGERVIALSRDLLALDTVPLTVRVTPALGISADRYYIYVNDDRAIFRMSRQKLELQPWLANVRVAGMTSYSPGEMLVADAERGVILHKTVFGESRRFLGTGDISRPGALAALPDGRFCAVSGNSRLVFFNRSAVVLRSAVLPGNGDLLAAGESGALYVVRRGSPVLWVVRDGRTETYELVGAGSPSGLALAGDRLAVLDAHTRLITYALP